MSELRTAQAAERPCELYAHSSAPKPTRTQGHHPKPVYLTASCARCNRSKRATPLLMYLRRRTADAARHRSNEKQGEACTMPAA